VLSNHCPHCREGHLFISKNPYNLTATMKMPETCPVCGQRFELEQGFYFGTGYVSYALSVLLTGLTFIVWYFTIGISIYNNSIYYWLASNAVCLILLQPILQRLSRSMWIAFFVKYDPASKSVGSLQH
jgi:uncharacterized protein (DUF983 family)